MRVATPLARRRKRGRTIAVVAGVWLFVLPTGCSFLADLDFATGDATPGIRPEAGDGSSSADARSNKDSAAGSDPYSSAVRADQPSAYWRFGESSGTTANDEMGAYPGVYERGFSLRAEGAIASNTAVRLDGEIGSRILIGDVFDFSSDSPSTLEAWVKWDGTGSAYIFSKRGDQTNGNNGYELYASSNSSGQVQWTYSRTTRGQPTLLFHDAQPSNEFVHVVATFDGAMGRLYLNGEEVSNLAFSNSVVGSGAVLALGNNAAGDGDSFQGTLDELAIYERVLSPDRIRAHYRASISK
ncbi:LamG domain-containing protein [Pendulispora brunnea]|uniref:LamG domain-containing protein n=1 Tax=Pendulispora brunnea TaxID=2905690 RepID=A0ABZ2KK58_9BACT